MRETARRGHYLRALYLAELGTSITESSVMYCARSCLGVCSSILTNSSLLALKRNCM